MRNISNSLVQSSAAIEQDTLLDLYQVDLTFIGGDLLRFHAGLNEKGETLVWQGKSYPPYPIQANGFEFNGQGTSNRPKLTVANISGLLTGLNEDFDDLVGAIVTRRQVPRRALDAVNFKQGNPQADATQELVSRYVIERLTNLTSEAATYELALPSESDGAMLPARVIISDICPWEYRSASCSYRGSPVADEKDNPTTSAQLDKCGKRLNSCKMRFGKNGILPFGGFPSAAKLSR
ncbi:MAG: phage minor tail protein L [Chania sp.]